MGSAWQGSCSALRWEGAKGYFSGQICTCMFERLQFITTWNIAQSVWMYNDRTFRTRSLHDKEN